jgi:hypothetical protein
MDQDLPWFSKIMNRMRPDKETKKSIVSLTWNKSSQNKRLTFLTYSETLVIISLMINNLIKWSEQILTAKEKECIASKHPTTGSF